MHGALLAFLILALAGAVACAPAAPAPPTAAPTTAPAAKPTTAPAAPTTAPAAAAPAAASPAAASPGAASPPVAASPVAKPAASPAAAASPVVAAPSPAPAAAGAGGPATAAASISQVRPLATRGKIKMALSPDNIAALPLFLALDKGYFDRANIEVEVELFRGGGGSQLPRLARGDIDILPAISPQPGFFNVFNEGFEVKILASQGTERPGRLTPAWLTVLKDKQGEIKELADLRGKTIEGGAVGTPLDLLAREAARAANLRVGTDVTITYRVRQTADMITLARSKAADVIVMNEPNATNAEKEGLVVRWKGLADVTPWFQPSLLGFSPQFSANQGPVAAKFLEAYLVAVREVNASNGEWTPDLLASATKRLNVDASVITSQGKVPYYDPNGAISMESLQRAHDIWLDTGELKQRVDVSRVVNSAPLEEALRNIGRAS